MSTYTSKLFSCSPLIPILMNAPEPDGYRRFHIGREEIPPSTFNLSLSALKFYEQSINSYLENQTVEFFEKLGVEIVADESKEIELTQIRLSVAKSFYELFKKIEQGSSPIKFLGDQPFNQKCLELIKQLLGRPSGRYLIQSISQSEYPIHLIKGQKNGALSRIDDHFNLNLNFDNPTPEIQFYKNEKKKVGTTVPILILSHELIHILQYIQIDKKISESKKLDKEEDVMREIQAQHTFFTAPSKHGHYVNLCEAFTIGGIENENYICEQMIRYEFSYPKRYGHVGPVFFPIDINNPNDDPHGTHRGFTRISYAAFLGFEEEVMKLLALKADVQEALVGAAFGGHLDLLKTLIDDHGAIANAAPNRFIFKDTAVHQAAVSGHVHILKYLKSIGADLSLCNAHRQTPLHIACLYNQPKVIEYLIKENCSLNSLTTNIYEATPLDSLVKNNGSLDAIKMLIEAGGKMTQDWYQILCKIYTHENPEIKEKREYVKSLFEGKEDLYLIKIERNPAKRKTEALNDLFNH